MTEETFRVTVATTHEGDHHFDGIPAEDAVGCVRKFTERSEDGLRFFAPTGVFSWTWDEVDSVAVVRL